MAKQPGQPKAPAKPKKPKFGGLKQPPVMSYDPSIEAERRSQQRGLKDVLRDTRRARNYAQQDYGQQLADLNLAQSRGVQDIGSNISDINLRQQRGTEDFSNQLTNLIHGFQVKGREQTQVANQAGVLDSSTARAAAARRAENLAIARQPIDIGQGRLNENTLRALAEQELSRGRLSEDTARGLRLAGIDVGRTLADLKIKKRRAIREQRIGNIDLLQEEIFGARQLKPGAFTQTGAPKKKKKR
jgi:hypothetical protein